MKFECMYSKDVVGGISISSPIDAPGWYFTLGVTPTLPWRVCRRMPRVPVLACASGPLIFEFGGPAPGVKPNR